MIDILSTCFVWVMGVIIYSVIETFDPIDNYVESVLPFEIATILWSVTLATHNAIKTILKVRKSLKILRNTK